MTPPTALRSATLWSLTLALGVLPGSGGRLNAADGPPPQGEPAARPPTPIKGVGPMKHPGRAEAEEPILAVDEEFVRDYNKGDAKALAGRFTEDAEVLEESGERYRGRDLIERRMAETFADQAGVKLALEVGPIRFLSPDVAQEEGRTLVTPAQGPAVRRHYSVLFVRREGRWWISSVREEPDDEAVRPHDRLKPLAWMVGDWIDESATGEVRVACRWSEDGNFLLRTLTLRMQGKPVMNVTQRIGWDPQARQIRSWEFDSEGGFSQGTWSHDGERWVVKHTGVRPDGTTASATNTLTRVRADMAQWISTDRVLGADSFPGDESFVLVRTPPPARGGTQGASPNNVRSPQ